MKLSPQAILILQNTDNSKLRNRLVYELDTHINSLNRWIEKNEENGDLTKILALQIIEEETGLAQEEILLEEVSK